jgi:xanthine dehydrogenase accessory factor
MIGSKRRVAIVMDMLKEEGYSEERIGRIHSPIGLKIGAITPFEIAISIISEIISVKRLGLGAGELACCDLDIVRELAEAAGEYDALVTICDSYGSVPIDCGAKLAMSYVGKLAGTVGGGCSEAEAMQVARELIQAGGGWRTHDIDMTDSAEEDGMVCGGMMRVVIETIPK